MSRPELSVILVAHDSRDDLERSLPALALAGGDLRVEVLAVDNASSDGSVELLREWCGDGAASRTLLEGRVNEGLARAVNRALARARAPRLAVLNPDVVPAPGSLAGLAAALDAGPDVGLVLPRLNDEHGAWQPSCRTFYDPLTILARRAPLLNRWLGGSRVVRRHLMLDWDHAGERDVDWGQGAALMVRRAALARPDWLLDPRYFLYFEDVDLAWSMWDRGWRVRYVPRATMTHRYRRQSQSLVDRAALYHLASGVKFLARTRGQPPRHRGHPR